MVNATILGQGKGKNYEYLCFELIRTIDPKKEKELIHTLSQGLKTKQIFR